MPTLVGPGLTSQEFSGLLRNGPFSDVVLAGSDVRRGVRGHRAVLASSPFLRRLFHDPQVRGLETTAVLIPDVPSAAVDAFLSYLYGETVAVTEKQKPDFDWLCRTFEVDSGSDSVDRRSRCAVCGSEVVRTRMTDHLRKHKLYFETLLDNLVDEDVVHFFSLNCSGCRENQEEVGLESRIEWIFEHVQKCCHTLDTLLADHARLHGSPLGTFEDGETNARGRENFRKTRPLLTVPQRKAKQNEKVAQKRKRAGSGSEEIACHVCKETFSTKETRHLHTCHSLLDTRADETADRKARKASDGLEVPASTAKYQKRSRETKSTSATRLRDPLSPSDTATFHNDAKASEVTRVYHPSPRVPFSGPKTLETVQQREGHSKPFLLDDFGTFPAFKIRAAPRCVKEKEYQRIAEELNLQY